MSSQGKDQPENPRRVAPNEATIRRTLQAIDGDLLDSVVNTWAAGQVAEGRLLPEQAEQVRSVMAAAIEEEEASEDDEQERGTPTDGDEPDGEGPALLPIAVDGKTLRGARLEDNRQVHLLSASTHAEGVVVAQRNVDTKTNEITGFAPLLEGSTSMAWSLPRMRCTSSGGTRSSCTSGARTSSSGAKTNAVLV